MDRDCGSSVAGEEEGGSAPPLFQLLNSAQHIDSIYNDSRQLEWPGPQSSESKCLIEGQLFEYKFCIQIEPFLGVCPFLSDKPKTGL